MLRDQLVQQVQLAQILVPPVGPDPRGSPGLLRIPDPLDPPDPPESLAGRDQLGIPALLALQDTAQQGQRVILGLRDQLGEPVQQDQRVIPEIPVQRD